MHEWLAVEGFDKVSMSKEWSEVLSASSVTALWVIGGNRFGKEEAFRDTVENVKYFFMRICEEFFRFYSQWNNRGNFLKIYPHRLVCIQPLFLMCSLPPFETQQ